MDSTPNERETYHRHSKDVDGNDSDDSACSDIDEPVLVGTKRDRNYEDDEQDCASDQLDHYHDPVSAIVLRAKRLRISDRATENRDREVRQMRTKQEGKGTIVPDTTSLESRVPVQPSLGGLPEELVLEILLDLDLFDIMALRRVSQNT